MTALKPIENRRVRGVASERYPLNRKCAHPECSAEVADPHHAFPRSAIGNDSWFVEIAAIDGPVDVESPYFTPEPIPHVTGLCRQHHHDVEEHRAWIRLEDGVFVWFDRAKDLMAGEPPEPVAWEEIGPLNPQPGSVEGKRKKRRHKGEARRKRRTLSIKVPDDAAEDGGGLWDDLMERVDEKLDRLGLDVERPAYHKLSDALNDWCSIPDSVSETGEVQSRKRCQQCAMAERPCPGCV